MRIIYIDIDSMRPNLRQHDLMKQTGPSEEPDPLPHVVETGHINIYPNKCGENSAIGKQ